MTDMKTMERDILQAALDGPLGPGTPKAIELASKYSDKDDDEAGGRRHITVAVDDLVNEGYLHPYFHSDGTRGKTAVSVRGITFKGRRRLRELKNPWLVWAGRNWFPLLIAGNNSRDSDYHEDILGMSRCRRNLSYGLKTPLRAS